MPSNDELLASFVKHMGTDRGSAPNTIDAYTRDIKQLLAFLGRKPVSKLDAASYRAFLQERRMAVGASSLARQAAAIKEFSRFLEREHGLALRGPEAVRVRTPPRPLPRPVQVNTAKKIIAGAPPSNRRWPWADARDQAVLTLLYGAGLRISEALAIDAGDAPIDPDGALLVKGKGNKERMVPIIPAVAEAVQRYIAVCPFELEKGSLLFRGTRGGPLSPRLIQKAVERMRGALDLDPRVTPHALRHSFATHLVDRGVDLRSMQMLLGHENVSTTARYTEVTRQKLIEDIDRFHPRSKD